MEGIELPPRHLLAHIPTPLELLERTSRRLCHAIYVKRDDLTGAALSGNKVRKLEFLVAEAKARNADTLITCGGVNSNHARATAIAAAAAGMTSSLVLRGVDRHPPTGNLLLDRLVGAEISFISAEDWRSVDARMEAHAERLRAAGRRPYVIPEGGSSALGALGYVLAARELVEQADARGLELGRVVHAVGSGGTTAGLALGLAALGRAHVDVLGIAVTDETSGFDRKIAAILDEAVDRGWASAAVRARARWKIVAGYRGQGYAQSTPEEVSEYAGLAQREGLIVDPVYTGKAFRGLLGELAAGRFAGPGLTVFLHTGGIFELFAHAAKLTAPKG